MKFAWIGFMRDGAEASPSILREVTGFLEQPYIRISSAGSLHDNAGRRAGMMMIFEAQDHAAAEALVAESPFPQGEPLRAPSSVRISRRGRLTGCVDGPERPT